MIITTRFALGIDGAEIDLWRGSTRRGVMQPLVIADQRGDDEIGRSFDDRPWPVCHR
jgi:hypothetical protein